MKTLTSNLTLADLILADTAEQARQLQAAAQQAQDEQDAAESEGDAQAAAHWERVGEAISSLTRALLGE